MSPRSLSLRCRSAALAIVVAWSTGARADGAAFNVGDGVAETRYAPTTSAGDPPVGWAMLGGAASAMIPLAIGGALFGNTFDEGTRRAASISMVSGLALAPIVSHLIVREWTRAAIFGAIPVACVIGMTTLLELEPAATVYGTREGRLTFGLLLAFSTLASGIGLADTLGATRRAKDRRLTATPTALPIPFATVGGGGLGIVGRF